MNTCYNNLRSRNLLRLCGRVFRDDTINGPLRMFERYFSRGGR
jgi:hypothetical protein